MDIAGFDDKRSGERRQGERRSAADRRLNSIGRILAGSSVHTSGRRKGDRRSHDRRQWAA